MSQEDVDAFTAKCDALRQSATEQEQRIVVSCALENSWTVTLRFFFRPTPDGSRQVVCQAGKTIAFCKVTELMQWQHQS